jgi:YVTN family beta-propeller protein
MIRTLARLLCACALCAPAARAQGLAAAEPPPFDDVKSRYTQVEVSPLATLALSDDGTRIYAVNQGGARLVVLDAVTLAQERSVPIGPGVVTLVRRPGTGELWLVDSITGSVSVMNSKTGVIQLSIRVGAEPMGLAFAPSGDRAYVTCSAERSVDVIETATRTRVASIPVPALKPRGVAVVGERAFVTPFLSGNNTATRGSGRGVHVNDAAEVRSLADFPALAQLPDRDLLVIVSDPDPAKDALDLSQTVTGLGTVLFAVRRRPGTDELWIPHTDALNAVHKGAQNFVAGQVVRNRLAIVDTSGGGPPRIVDLDQLAPGVDATCAQPTSVCFDPGGTRAFVTGYGSDRIAVLDIAGSQVSWAGHVEVAATTSSPPTAGPRDALVHPDGSALYVHDRIDNALVRVDLATLPATPGFSVQAPPAVSLGLDPTPLQVRRGRSHANNARFSKSGTSSCESCHVDGHVDGLVWDLSDYADPEGTPNAALAFGLDVKGPLATQSLRSLAETGPYHWRGERRSLFDFNSTFVGLLEREENGQPAPLPGEQFAYIVLYMQGLAWPANPRQHASRRYSAQELAGARLFQFEPVQGSASCASCHSLPLGTQNELVSGDPRALAASTVVPQLRGVAEKELPAHVIGGSFGTRNELGAGFNHGGVLPTLRHVLLQEEPGAGGVQKFDLSQAEADAIAAFLAALDTGLAPSTAFQVTANWLNALHVESHQLSFLIGQATLGHCDLIFRRAAIQLPGGALHEAGLYDPLVQAFRPARAGGAPIDPHQLIQEAIDPGKPVTFIGLPLFSGRVQALDADGDFLLDHDELARGTGLDAWDSDLDGLPDGYEVLHGLDPKQPDTSVPDTQAPALRAPVRVVYVTQTALKLELEASEVVRLEVSLDGGPPVLRLPFEPLSLFDERFSFVVSGLEHGTQYEVFLELTDPAGNQTVESLPVATPPRRFGDPVHVEEIALAITGSGPHGLDAALHLLRGSQPPAPGYLVRGQVFQRTAAGALSMLAPSFSATSDAAGIARLSLALPPQPATASEVFLVIDEVVAPLGKAPYVRGLSRAVYASIPY